MPTGATPDDVLSFEIEAEPMPRVGMRFAMVRCPRERTDDLLRTGHVQRDDVPWEVFRVEPVEGKPDRVTVYIRAC